MAAQSLHGTLGNQSLRISNAETSGSFGDQTFSRPLADEAGESGALDNGLSGGVRQARFEAKWVFAPAVAEIQEGLSVVASPDRGDGSRMSWVEMADTGAPGGLEVNFFDVQGHSPVGTANFVAAPVAAGLSRGEPHTIKLTIDFLDGESNDVVKIYVDGQLGRTGTTWEDYYRFDPEALPEGGPRTVDSVLFRTSGAAATATKGKGFLIDGVRLVSGAVPVTPTPPTAESQLYDGNKDCADLAPDGVTWEDFKIDAAPDNGEHQDPDSDLVITISNASDQTFDWHLPTTTWRPSSSRAAAAASSSSTPATPTSPTRGCTRRSAIDPAISISTSAM